MATSQLLWASVAVFAYPCKYVKYIVLKQVLPCSCLYVLIPVFSLRTPGKSLALPCCPVGQLQAVVRSRVWEGRPLLTCCVFQPCSGLAPVCQSVLYWGVPDGPGIQVWFPRVLKRERIAVLDLLAVPANAAWDALVFFAEECAVDSCSTSFP